MFAAETAVSNDSIYNPNSLINVRKSFRYQDVPSNDNKH